MEAKATFRAGFMKRCSTREMIQILQEVKTAHTTSQHNEIWMGKLKHICDET